MSGLRVEHGSVTVLRLDKPRGNSIDEPLVDALQAAVAAAARDPAVRGLLLASARPDLFCPGLDLVALADYAPPDLTRFMRKFGALLVALFGFPKPTLAALGGHAIAGGCLLALTTDYRVLRRGGVKVGLNEAKIGVPMPWPVTVLLRATVPVPALTRVALLGLNFQDDEAVTVGLVHEVVSGDGFEATCRARLGELAERDPNAYATTKGWLRAPALADMQAREEEVDQFVATWFSPGTQARLRAAVAALTARRSD